MKLHFLAFSSSSFVQDSLSDLINIYGQSEVREADTIIALGGDGSVLRAIHSLLTVSNAPIFSMNRGSYGFLTNSYRTEDLVKRIKQAVECRINPLSVTLKDADGKIFKDYAINEVYVMRSTHQASKLKVSIDGTIRIYELVGDGIIVATPVGSTAYNYSAHGPILPFNSEVISMTALSSFRPKHWKGAVIDSSSVVEMFVLEPIKRPVSVVADYIEYSDIRSISVAVDKSIGINLLFDPHFTLKEKIISEQFDS